MATRNSETSEALPLPLAMRRRRSDMAVWFDAIGSGWDPEPWRQGPGVVPAAGWRESADGWNRARELRPA